MYTNIRIKMSTLNSNIKTINKKVLHEEINDFYRRIKLKAHFIDNTKEQTQAGIFI